jgi:hypothetical protein
LIIVITLAYITPVAVDAAQTVESHMEALDCIIHGTPGPTDNLNPHMALVTDFVLFLGNGGEHYLLPITRSPDWHASEGMLTLQSMEQ